MYNEEEPTIQIPVETMREARERSVPARMIGNYEGAYGEGFAPAGPMRPTRDIRVPIEAESAVEEITEVDGIPVPVNPDYEDTEPLLRFAS